MKNVLKMTSSLLLAALLALGIPVLPIYAENGLAAVITNPSFDSSGFGAYDRVFFGNYNNEPIDWRVLETDDANNKVFLFQEDTEMSAYFNAIDDWKQSTLRTYLNNEFLSNLSVTAGEEAIADAIVEVDGDKVSLLENVEVMAYFTDEADRKATDLSGQYVNYWTRSPFTIIGHGYLVCIVDDGVIRNTRAIYDSGVRPVMNINLSGLFNSGSGTESDPFLITGDDGDKNIEAGSFVKFGNILWQVLDVQDGAAKIISKYVLEQRQFFDRALANKWEVSSIRKLLNPVNGVYQQETYAFEQGEADTVLTTTLNDVNTSDRFFFLSMNDYNNKSYFGETPSANLVTNKGFWLRNGGSTEYIYAVDGQGNLTQAMESNQEFVRPAFWMDWNRVVFASAIKDDPGENPTVTQSGNGYVASDSDANNYKLTVINNSIGSLSGLPEFGEADSEGYAINGATVQMNDPDTSSYCIAYKIVDENGEIIGYDTAPAESDFTIKTTDLYKDAESDAESLSEGTYSVYVWLQKNNQTSSNEATTPVKITMSIVADGETVITVLNGSWIFIKRKQSVQLEATVTPAQKLVWDAPDTKYFDITPDGYLTAKNSGLAFVRVTAADGTTKIITIAVSN